MDKDALHLEPGLSRDDFADDEAFLDYMSLMQCDDDDEAPFDAMRCAEQSRYDQITKLDILRLCTEGSHDVETAIGAPGVGAGFVDPLVWDDDIVSDDCNDVGAGADSRTRLSPSLGSACADPIAWDSDDSSDDVADGCRSSSCHGDFDRGFPTPSTVASTRLPLSPGEVHSSERPGPVCHLLSPRAQMPGHDAGCH